MLLEHQACTSDARQPSITKGLHYLLTQTKKQHVKFPQRIQLPTFEQEMVFLCDQSSIPQAGMMSWPYAYFMTASTVDWVSNSFLAMLPWGTPLHPRATEWSSCCSKLALPVLLLCRSHWGAGFIFFLSYFFSNSWWISLEIILCSSVFLKNVSAGQTIAFGSISWTIIVGERNYASCERSVAWKHDKCCS